MRAGHTTRLWVFLQKLGEEADKGDLLEVIEHAEHKNVAQHVLQRQLSERQVGAVLFEARARGRCGICACACKMTEAQMQR